MAEFNSFSLQIPNEIFGIKISNKQNGSGNKEMKENIIIQLPVDSKISHTDMQE